MVHQYTAIPRTLYSYASKALLIIIRLSRILWNVLFTLITFEVNSLYNDSCQ